MRLFIEQSNDLAPLSPSRSWLDCTTNTSGYDFRKEQVRLGRIAHVRSTAPLTPRAEVAQSPRHVGEVPTGDMALIGSDDNRAFSSGPTGMQASQQCRVKFGWHAAVPKSRSLYARSARHHSRISPSTCCSWASCQGQYTASW